MCRKKRQFSSEIQSMKHIHILWAVMLTFLTVLALPAHAARFNPKRTQKIASENDFVQLVENMANSMQPTAYIVFEKKMSPLFLKNLNRAMYFNHATHYYYYFRDNQIQVKFNFADSALLLAAYRNPKLRKKLTPEQKEALKIAEECIKKCVASAKKREDIVLFLHDEVAKLCEYDTGKPNQSCIRVLLHHKGDCGAYARTMYLFLSMLDIPCHVIQGENISGGPHCWNLVQFDSGRWYHVDSCKDDRFGGDKNPYKYFGLTDEQNRKFHFWDEEYFPATPIDK